MRKLLFLSLLLVVAVCSYLLGRFERSPGDFEPALAPPSPRLEAVAKRNAKPIIPKNVTDMPARSMAFARSLTASERGYNAAIENLEDALKQIESTPAPERKGFVTGLFSFVAGSFPPANALKIYQRAPEEQRGNALRALVAEWVYGRSGLDEEGRSAKRETVLTLSGDRHGLEVELSAALASAKPDNEVASAWLEAFSNHAARSEILSMFTGQLGVDGPDSILNRTEGWTSWEKERVARTVLARWAVEKPQDAWDWYQSHRGGFEQDLSSSVIGPWAYSNLDAAKGLLDTLSDQGQRQSVIEVIGKTLAMKNTNAAVDWADGFTDATEREIAQRAVYDGAPRGIGAVLDMKAGFPTVRGIVPGSPLEGTGIQPGDQFVEVRQADGTKQPLFGRDLEAAVNLIRGEPGTEMTLRVLRRNGTGALEELLVPVKRGQLYFDEKLRPQMLN